MYKEGREEKMEWKWMEKYYEILHIINPCTLTWILYRAHIF